MRALRWMRVGVAIAGLALFCQPVRADDSQTKGKEQIWEGTLKVAPGIELRLVIHATVRDGAEPLATLDSPDESLRGLKLSSVVIDRSRLAFELKVTQAAYDGKLNAAGTEATGTWTQRGGQLPLSFVKKDKATPEPKLVGKEQIWEGKLGPGPAQGLRLVVRVQKTEDGRLLANFQSPDQGAMKLKVDSITLDKTKLAFAMKALDIKYEGKLNGEENEAVGTFTQGGMKLSLTLKKTDQGNGGPQAADAQAPVSVQGRRAQVSQRAGGDHARGNADLAGRPRSISGCDLDQRLGCPGSR